MVVWDRPSGGAVAGLEAFSGQHEETSEGHVFRASDEATANAFVQHVTGGGGRILQVVPQRQSLEELFVTEARADPGTGDDA
jgi:hypothetical protein